MKMPFAALTLLLLGSMAAAQTDVPLAHRAFRTFRHELPAPQTAPVGTTIPIPHSGGDGFPVEARGLALAIDSDADGTFDVELGPEAESVVVLQGKTKAGHPLRYAARLIPSPTGWVYTTAGAQVGEVGGTKVFLFDQNLNGRYDDLGVDALAVGRNEVCSYLSKTINVDGKLHTIAVAADGASLSAAPYTGPAGVLDLHGKLEANGKLLAAIVRSEDGNHSFDLSDARDGLTVPAGRYRLLEGAFGLGDGRVHFVTGRAHPITVKAGETASLKWGGALRGEFDYQRQGGQIGFTPDRVWYYGRAGEQYVNWTPLGQSPVFSVRDVKDQREIIRAQFPGSC